MTETPEVQKHEQEPEGTPDIGTAAAPERPEAEAQTVGDGGPTITGGQNRQVLVDIATGFREWQESGRQSEEGDADVPEPVEA